ncbi:MAG: archaellin/type IV pilin N-terminal domain-containing protein [Nitrososphaerales archaeon]
MSHSSLARYHKRRGVSEVLGALLLIVVVVATVASLSVFLSQATANSENRNAYLTSVQNENLQVTAIQLEPNNPAVQWELDHCPTPSCPPNGLTVFYLTPINDSAVTLNQQNTTTSTQAALTGFFYSQIVAGTTANIITTVNPITSLNHTTISLGSGGVLYTFNPATWENATITIRNLNTAESGLYQLNINQNWMTSWRDVSETGSIISYEGATKTPLDVVAKGSVQIYVDVSKFYSFAKDAPFDIELLTSAGNYFDANYAPPVALATAGTSTENYLITTRDIITFGGSTSFTSGAPVQSYVWKIDVPDNGECSVSSFANGNYISAYVAGESVPYLPESLFPNDLTASSGVCITGPIRATLTIADTNGFLSTSQPILLPQDPNIAPPADIVLSSTAPSPLVCPSASETVTSVLNNIYGEGQNGVAVVAFPSGGVSLISPASMVTSTSGGNPGLTTFTIGCSGTGGTLELVSGTLPPLIIPVG